MKIIHAGEHRGDQKKATEMHKEVGEQATPSMGDGPLCMCLRLTSSVAVSTAN